MQSGTQENKMKEENNKILGEYKNQFETPSFANEKTAIICMMNFP